LASFITSLEVSDIFLLSPMIKVNSCESNQSKKSLWQYIIWI